MKFTITMKDPDGPYDSLKDAVDQHIASLKELNADLTDEDLEDIRENKTEYLNDFIRMWLQYGEYVTIEFDTETNTATIKKS